MNTNGGSGRTRSCRRARFSFQASSLTTPSRWNILKLVADRIVRYAELVGRENVIAGSDCGFAQSDAIQRVHPTVMWAKFESLVEGARLASKKLW